MATETGGFGALLSAFDRFYKTLDATTVPAEGGGRTVGGIAHAVALSEATDALYGELGAAMLRLFQQHGQSVAGSTAPANEAMSIGGKGADAVLLAALDSATRVAAFPIDKWNAMQAARPGANHQRFRAGDVVSAADLAALESAAKLLRLKAPLAPPEVSVSPDLLDQQQRAAAAIDESDVAILAFLNSNPCLRRKVTDVLPGVGPQDRKAVGKRLRKLADRTPPLLDFPKGGRSGVAILPAGIDVLKQATPPTPR